MNCRNVNAVNSIYKDPLWIWPTSPGKTKEKVLHLALCDEDPVLHSVRSNQSFVTDFSGSRIEPLILSNSAHALLQLLELFEKSQGMQVEVLIEKVWTTVKILKVQDLNLSKVKHRLSSKHLSTPFG